MIKFKLAEILEEKGLPQRYILKNAHMRSGTVNAYYHGFIKRMNVADLQKICNVLDCNLSDIVEITPDKK